MLLLFIEVELTYESWSRAFPCGRYRRPFVSLTNGFPLDGGVVGAARWASRATADSLGIELQFRDGAAQSIAMHTKLPSSLALVTIAVL